MFSSPEAIERGYSEGIGKNMREGQLWVEGGVNFRCSRNVAGSNFRAKIVEPVIVGRPVGWGDTVFITFSCGPENML